MEPFVNMRQRLDRRNRNKSGLAIHCVVYGKLGYTIAGKGHNT